MYQTLITASTKVGAQVEQLWWLLCFIFKKLLTFQHKWSQQTNLLHTIRIGWVKKQHARKLI